MSDDVPIVMTIFGVFGFVAWTITTNIRRSKTAHTVAELHARLLDKFSACQEVLGYLESEAGRKFLESASGGQTAASSRILGAIQAGSIFALAGLAALLVRSAVPYSDSQEFLSVVGSFAIAIGLGFLVSAAISYRLCRSWGLLDHGRSRAELAR